MKHAAIWHWYLLLCVYMILFNLIIVCDRTPFFPFFFLIKFFFFFKSPINESDKSTRYQHVIYVPFVVVIDKLMFVFSPDVILCG